MFTELLDMVEARYSLDLVDDVLAKANVSGSYTSVGYYEDVELNRIVVALSEESNIPVPQLLHLFGTHLFQRFVVLYPMFFSPHGSAPSFLLGLETHVHTEVRKLYANAHPPFFTFRSDDVGGYSLTYQSSRGLWQFAQGLLEACLEHYGQSLVLHSIDDKSEGAGTNVQFNLVPA
jgi:hypothetical protein